ncbi:MAG: hypothetical protein AAGU74_09010 [Bacillota bacterium]
MMLTKGAEHGNGGLYAAHNINYYLKLRYDAVFLEERRQAASALEKIMRSNERLARIFWKHVQAYAEAPIHSEVIENYDGTHDEYGVHGGYTKTFVSGGLGMAHHTYEASYTSRHCPESDNNKK